MMVPRRIFFAFVIFSPLLPTLTRNPKNSLLCITKQMRLSTFNNYFGNLSCDLLRILTQRFDSQNWEIQTLRLPR